MIPFLLLYWRWILIGALAAALGVQTYRLQTVQAAFDQYVLEATAAGMEAQAAAEAINAHQELVNEELLHDIATERDARARERKARADRFATLYGKYHGLLNADSGGGRLSETAQGPGKPVRESCFDQERLAAGIRRDLGALYVELESLVRRGEDGLDDALKWGQWGRLLKVCQPL